MQLKKLTLILILIAVAVGVVTYAAIDYIPAAATPVSTVPPKTTEQQPQQLFTFGNTDKSKLKQPIALAADEQGKIYVTDAGDSTVKIYRPNGKYEKSFGAKGTGNKNFRYPYGIVVLKNGDIAVADSINSNVRVFSNSGVYKKTILDTKQKIRPGSLSIDSAGNIYISDLLNHQIIVMNSAGKVTRKIKPAVSSLKYPQEVAFGQNAEKLWVADSGNFAVKEVDAKGAVEKIILGSGSPPQAFSLVRGIGVDNLDRVMVADTENGTIHVITGDGQEVFSFNGGGSPAGKLIYPSYILVDKSGKIYITDRGTGQVQVWGYQKK